MFYSYLLIFLVSHKMFLEIQFHICSKMHHIVFIHFSTLFVAINHYKRLQSYVLIDCKVETSHLYRHVWKASSLAVTLGIVGHSLHVANWCNHCSNEVWRFLQV